MNEEKANTKINVKFMVRCFLLKVKEFHSSYQCNYIQGFA